MKKINRKISYALICSLIAILFTSCSDKDYFFEENIQVTNKISTGTYEYLASMPNQFSQFVSVIDLTNSKDLINSANYTIIAPQNFSIERFVFEYGKKDITEFSMDELDALLKRYVINTKITSDVLGDALQVASEGDQELVFTIRQENWKGVENIGPEYISIDNLKDIDDDKDNIRVKVVTPDLETSTGIVQVLSKNHLFGF